MVTVAPMVMNWVIQIASGKRVVCRAGGIESQILARRTSLQQLGLALVQPLALLNSSNFCPAVSPRHAEANLFQDHNPGGHAVFLTLLSIDAGPASAAAPKGTDTKAAGAHSVIAKSVPSKTCVQASL